MSSGAMIAAAESAVASEPTECLSHRRETPRRLWSDPAFCPISRELIFTTIQGLSHTLLLPFRRRIQVSVLKFKKKKGGVDSS